MNTIAFDPSFKRTGVHLRTGVDFPVKLDNYIRTQYHGVSGEFIDSFESLSCKTEGSSFFHIARDAKELVDGISKLGGFSLYNYDYVIMEYPPPVGQFSAGLYALDVSILNMFMHYKQKVLLISSGSVNSWMGARSVTKTEIVERVKAMIGLKLNHDEASAFILTTIGINAVTTGKSHQKVYAIDNWKVTEYGS